MKTKLLICFFFFVLLNETFPQTWERAFGFTNGKEEGAYTICKLTDGSFIAAGFGEDEIPSTIKAIKVNANGDSIWSKKFIIPGSSDSRVYTSMSLESGCFLMGGSCSLNNDYSNHTAFLGKFDSDGNVLWIKTYFSSGVQYDFNEISRANDGGYIAKSMYYILKIDENGNYLWHRPNSYYNVNTILTLHNFKDGYLMATSNFPSLIRNIIKINNSGEVIWKKDTYNFFYPSTLLIHQNNFFAFGGTEDTITHYIIYEMQSYDTLGNYVTSKILNVQRIETGSGFFLQIDSNRFLFSNTSPLTFGTHYCTIRLIDTNMNLLKTLDLTTTGGFRGLYSAVKQDEKYVLAAGNISLHLGYGYEDFYVIKTDTNLNLQVSIGIKKIENEFPKDYNLFQNYPNPFNPITKIKFSIPARSEVVLNIYDVTGKLIQTLVDKKLEAGLYETIWDASSFSSGTYFCRMTTDKFTKTSKLILLK